MGFAELFVLAVGLSMDAFAVSVCKGLCLGEIKAKHMWKAGVWFGGFQALMPLLGYLLGSAFAGMINKYAHWIAFILLLFLGVKMMKEAFGEEELVACDTCDISMSAKKMLVLAVATSIDAMAVGVTFAFLQVAIIPAISFIGVTTFIFSAVGIRIGSIFGVKYKSRAEIFGGVILILMGAKILLDGLGVL